MDTTAAAQQAGVTVATIRTWCRRRVVSAVKQAGRWVIDAASLAYRISLGRKVPMDAPIVLTNKTRTVPSHIAAVGPREQLRAAFEAGTPVTLSGKYEGERVYLGHTRQTWDDGVTVETIGEDRVWEHDGMTVAAYLIDLTRLDDAPRLAALVAQVEARRAENAARVEGRVAAEERRLENLAEDGA